MLYNLIKFKVMTDGSLVLTPWKQHLEKMISELKVLQADRRDIGIQYIEPRELDVRILFYNSNYRETFVRTNLIKIAELSALWLPDSDVIKAPNTTKPETDDLKSVMNSIYGVKNMKKLIDTDSIYISTAGYDPDSMTKDFAKLRRLVVDSPFAPNIIVAPKEWTGEGYKKLFEKATIYCDNEPFTFDYKEDKNLDKKIRHIQINEEKRVVTIVWKDGEVTMARCSPNDTWDPEKGLLVCVAKRQFKSSTQFNKWRKSVIPEQEDDTTSLLDQIVENIVNKYQPKHAK